MNEKIRSYKKLIEALRLLSADSDQQIKYFPEYSDGPFEVLDTYSNAFRMLPEIIENNIFETKSIAALLRLKNMIEIIIDAPDFNEIKEEDLMCSKRWSQLRVLAKEILRNLNESDVLPDPDCI